MNRWDFYDNIRGYKETKEDSLAHYGIIGQKWGTRRWQNQDGTFNEEGKIRYFGSNSKNNKVKNEENKQTSNNVKINYNVDPSMEKYQKEINEEAQKILKNTLEISDGKNIPKNMTVNVDKDGKIKVDFDYDDKEKIGGLISWQTSMKHKINQGPIHNKMRNSMVKDAIKKRELYDAVNLTDDEIREIAKKIEFPQGDGGDWIHDAQQQFKHESLKYQLEKALNTKFGAGENGKIGMVAEYPIAIISSIKNYKNGEQLIQDIDKVISTGDEKYSKEELSSIMSNKKKLATMMDAADKGDDETYNKMAKKIKDKDKEAIEKFMKDANNQIIKTPVDENIQKDIEKIGGFTKPKINKKYLNEDGTLNELGLKNTERNRKTSRVFASIFKGLRNANVYGGTVGTGILFAIMAATGVGMPAAISIALAGAATSGITAGVDHALYKKLEKRADNYYTELKTRV